MKSFTKANRILLALLAVAVLVSLTVIARRWQIESENKIYDVILDYNELELLAQQSDEDISWWLEQFKDMGITRVGLTEESLTSLMESSPLSVTSTMMDTVIQDADWRDNYPAEFISAITDYGYDRFDVLVEISGEEATTFVTEAVEQRFHPEDVVMLNLGEEAYILLNGEVNDTLYLTDFSYSNTFKKGFTERNEIVASKLMYISLGLMPSKVDIIQSLGMEIVPRTICYDGHNDTRYAQAVVAGYERYGIDPTYIIAGGEAVIGFDDEDDYALSYMKENDITLGLIETNVQRENILQSGVETIAQETDYNAVRVFSVWDYIQYRYGYYGYEGAEEVENTLFRAIVERNIRVIYFKPVKQTDNSFAYITDVQVYRDLFSSLNDRLAAHGISMGEASVMDNYQIPSITMLILGLGAGIGGALLPATFLPMKKKWTYLLAGAAVVCVFAAWLVLPNLFRLLASFASSVVFACLAAVFFLRAAKRSGIQMNADAPLRRILPRCILVLLGSALIALAGAMMTAAPLSSTNYMLEFGIFRGVKAAQLLPLAFFCLLFLSYYGLFQKDRASNTLDFRDIVTAMKWNIPVWSLVLLAVVGLCGYYYLARTGHESDVSVSTLEIMMRNDLENLLLARPRTKEFLVAFPGIMLAVYCAVRRLPFWTALFGLAGTIGLTSICNTFMHIHTPLYLGSIRTGYSLLFGIVIGCVMILCFDLLYKWYRKYLKKYMETERK